MNLLIELLPAGGGAGVTLSLLYANKLRELVMEFKGSYDKVLFDSPPLIGVSDAAVLASITDASVFLIQHRRNPASMVQRAKQITDAQEVKVLGVILNQVPPRTGEDYGYYTNNYSYYSHEKPSRGSDKAPTKGERPAERLDFDEPSRPPRA